MNWHLKKHLLLISLLLIITAPALSQVIGKLVKLSDGETYQVAITPTKTLTAPKNITNTGQITLKVSTNQFQLKDLQSINGIWKFNTIISQPNEAPYHDYLVFQLAVPLVNPKYEANVEFPLFSFKNGSNCLDTLELIENWIDDFWPPNSKNANIGNQMTILDFGIDNAYHENDAENFRLVCTKSLNYKIQVDSIKCSDQTAILKIYFIEGASPFEYFIKLENGLVIHDSLFNEGDSVNIQIPMGHHSITGLNRKDTIIEKIYLSAPAPLNIEIVNQEKIFCNDLDGAKVLLKGTGGFSPESYHFEWSNGKTGASMEGLNAGIYSVTLSDKKNCTSIREIIIENPQFISFDSITLNQPTCFGDADGLIEIPYVTNGKPPFQYAINKNNYQTTNYFKNLSAGEYQLYVVDSNNCIATKSVFLENPPKLDVTLGVDTILYKGQNLQLNPTFSTETNFSYSWLPLAFLSCLDCLTPIAAPPRTIIYSLIINNDVGCEATASQQIEIIEDSPVYIPTAFSPNGDGQNDIFEIQIGPTIQSINSLSIFNRWGQLIYHRTKADNQQKLSWDGNYQSKIADTGVYIYIAEIQLSNEVVEIFKGDFFLLK